MLTLASTHMTNGLISVHGDDAEKFLQGQLTTDMTELNVNKAAFGAFCTPQGRVRASFLIMMVNSDEYLLILPKEQISFLVEALAPYVAFFQCEMTDKSDEWHSFRISTDQLDGCQRQADMPALPQTVWEVSVSDSIHCIRLPGESTRWFCLTQQPLDFVENSTTIDEEVWNKEDMLSGLIWINPSNRDKFLPHDLSMPANGAVSFTKGCYTGQEIIARMHYRGKPKYLLAIITTEPTDEKIPEKIIQLSDNSKEIKIGTIIEQLHLSDNSWLISASVKRMLLNQHNIQISSGERSILCNITIPGIAEESDNK